MKVLIVHNAYKQFGGEDVVVAQEAALLRLAGHAVLEYRRSNREIDALVFNLNVWSHPNLFGVESVSQHFNHVSFDGTGLTRGIKCPTRNRWRRRAPMQREQLQVFVAFAGQGEGVTDSLRARTVYPGESWQEFVDLRGSLIAQ